MELIPREAELVLQCSTSRNRMYSRTVRTMHNIVRLYDETGDVMEREGRGRPSLSKTKIRKVLMKIYRLIENFTRYRLV